VGSAATAVPGIARPFRRYLGAKISGVEGAPPIYMGIGYSSPVHHKELAFWDRSSTGGHIYRAAGTFGDSLLMNLGAGHGRSTLHNELEDLSHRIALIVGWNLSGSRWACSALPLTREGARRGTPRSERPRSSTAVASSLTSSSKRSYFRAVLPASFTRGTTSRRSAWPLSAVLRRLRTPGIRG